MLGTVIEVYAMFVEMINFLVLGGAGLKMACCCAIGRDE